MKVTIIIEDNQENILTQIDLDVEALTAAVTAQGPLVQDLINAVTTLTGELPAGTDTTAIEAATAALNANNAAIQAALPAAPTGTPAPPVANA